MVIVIADDITGAAEVAGIAHRKGYATRLATELETVDGNGCFDVLVLATDTRSMTEHEAVEVTCQLARRLPPGCTLFKKTDSALRGHVMAELHELLRATTYQQALWMPANPSKGRTIVEGIYYINGTAISDTDFSFDPEFPARQSHIALRFPGIAPWNPTNHAAQKGCSIDGTGIFYANADSITAIQQLTAALPPTTLAAGAADFFDCWLSKQLPVSNGLSGVTASSAHSPATNEARTGSLLLLCGSTQSRLPHIPAQVFTMPAAVYDGKEPVDAWATAIARQWQCPPTDKQTALAAILTFGDNRHRSGHEAAVYLREAMTRAAHTLIAHRRPDLLVIEGGATAFCLLQQLGWNTFTILQELAPGVVRMRAANSTEVILKPGSYPWGTGLF